MIDFVIRLPRFRGRFNALLVIKDCLTKLTYFILIKDNKSYAQLGQIYVRDIIRLYGVPKAIVLVETRDLFNILTKLVEIYRY